ncbi:MAG: TerC family protein [Bacteroidia bacterium]|nr:TerC family protein [Bacteroidia bacterium]
MHGTFLFIESISPESWLYTVFGIIVVTFLVLDLGVFNKNPHRVSTTAALIQSAALVAVSLSFGALIYYFDDQPTAAVEYLSAYVTEYALSVDNIFVIILIMRYFHVSDQYQHKVLFWGILGALIMRGIFIFIGAILIHEFHWILYIFGAFLVFTGAKMLFGKSEEDEEVNLDTNPVLRFSKKFLPFTTVEHGSSFWIRDKGKLLFTPLFMVIILIETTDLIFAVDSIPAVFSISQNEFVVYTSNIFAVLGLRAMFFVLSSVLNKFYLLSRGVSFILIFIGAKMLLELINIKIDTILSFIFIISVLVLSVVFSLIFPKQEKQNS